MSGLDVMLFDRRVLDAMVIDFGPDVIGHLVAAYRGSAPGYVRQASINGEGPINDDQRRVVHSLKSSSRALGLLRTGEMAAGIEARCFITAAEIGALSTLVDQGLAALDAYLTALAADGG